MRSTTVVLAYFLLYTTAVEAVTRPVFSTHTTEFIALLYAPE